MGDSRIEKSKEDFSLLWIFVFQFILHTFIYIIPASHMIFL